MGSNTRTLSASPGDGDALRLYALLQLGRAAARVHAQRGERAGDSGLQRGTPVQWGIPNVTLINYSSIGDNTEGPYENKNNSLQFLNNTSWIHGKHTLPFRRRDSARSVQPGGQPVRARPVDVRSAGDAESATKTGGDTFAGFLLGDLYQSEAAVSIARGEVPLQQLRLVLRRHLEGDAQLTLSLGLRYEHTPPLEDQTGNAVLGVHAVRGQHSERRG